VWSLDGKLHERRRHGHNEHQSRFSYTRHCQQIVDRQRFLVTHRHVGASPAICSHTSTGRTVAVRLPRVCTAFQRRDSSKLHSLSPVLVLDNLLIRLQITFIVFWPCGCVRRLFLVVCVRFRVWTAKLPS